MVYSLKMRLALELFKIFIFLITIKQTRSTIFNNAVNTHNQSYNYDDREVSTNGFKVPYIRICCPRRNMLANGECDDGLEEEIARTNPYLNLVENWNGSLKEYRYNLIDMTVIREEFHDSEELMSLGEDEFMLFEHGTILIHSLNWTTKDYCIYPYHIYSDPPKSIWMMFRKGKTPLLPAVFEISMISLLCYILTVATYIFIKELRNMLGKCCMCSLFCMFMNDLLSILDKVNLLNDYCSLAGYSKHFFKMASFLWLFVMSYQMWKGYRTVKRDPIRYRFLFYSIFAWSSAAIPTVLIFLINHGWEKDPHKWDWMPLVGFTRCSVNYEKWSAWMFFFLPILFPFFITMYIHISKVKPQLKKFSQRQQMKAISFNFDNHTYFVFLRLFTWKGIFWALNCFSLFVDRPHILWPVTWAEKYFNFSYGIFVFMFLVLKHSILRLLIPSKLWKGGDDLEITKI